MSKRAKILLIKYGSCLLFVALCAGIYVLDRCAGMVPIRQWKEFWAAVAASGRSVPLKDWLHWFCDGLTLPSVVLLSAGAMLWISNAGVFDLLGYTFRNLLRLFTSAERKSFGTYGDYVEEKKEKRLHGYGFLLISGGISMGLTLLLLSLYLSIG